MLLVDQRPLRGRQDADRLRIAPAAPRQRRVRPEHVGFGLHACSRPACAEPILGRPAQIESPATPPATRSGSASSPRGSPASNPRPRWSPSSPLTTWLAEHPGGSVRVLRVSEGADCHGAEVCAGGAGLCIVANAVSRRAAGRGGRDAGSRGCAVRAGAVREAALRFAKGATGSGPRPRWVPMLDGLDLLLRWFCEDVRGRFPDSPVLLCDESGGRLASGTIRNRLRHLMISRDGRRSSGSARTCCAGLVRRTTTNVAWTWWPSSNCSSIGRWASRGQSRSPGEPADNRGDRHVAPSTGSTVVLASQARKYSVCCSPPRRRRTCTPRYPTTRWIASVDLQLLRFLQQTGITHR
jgi:hypothetical protein